jgi:hypothetical protein
VQPHGWPFLPQRPSKRSAMTAPGNRHPTARQWRSTYKQHHPKSCPRLGCRSRNRRHVPQQPRCCTNARRPLRDGPPTTAHPRARRQQHSHRHSQPPDQAAQIQSNGYVLLLAPRQSRPNPVQILLAGTKVKATGPTTSQNTTPLPIIEPCAQSIYIPKPPPLVAQRPRSVAARVCSFPGNPENITSHQSHVSIQKCQVRAGTIQIANAATFPRRSLLYHSSL